MTQLDFDMSLLPTSPSKSIRNRVLAEKMHRKKAKELGKKEDRSGSSSKPRASQKQERLVVGKRGRDKDEQEKENAQLIGNILV
jgi:hypothetical protein